MKDSTTNPKALRSDTAALTGVRAIGAYLVYLHHIHWVLPGLLGSMVSHFSREAHSGVTLFFVLSGFVIALNYFESAEGNVRWMGTYYWNRFVRIFPMYWFVLYLDFVLVEPMGDSRFWILNLTLFKCFDPDTLSLGLGQTWSLGVEVCFYLVAPLVFLFARQGGRLNRLLSGLLIFDLAIFGAWKASQIWQLVWEPPWMYLYFWTFFGRMFEFAIGVGVARWMQLPRWGESVRGAWRTYGGLAACACVIGLMIACQEGESNASVFNPEGCFLNNVLLPVGIGVFFWGLVTEVSLVRRALSSRLFLFLGQASYTFYLIHNGPFAAWLNRTFPTDYYLGNFLVIQVAAGLLFVCIEKPVHQILRHLPRLGLKRLATSS